MLAMRSMLLKAHNGLNRTHATFARAFGVHFNPNFLGGRTKNDLLRSTYPVSVDRGPKGSGLSTSAGSGGAPLMPTASMLDGELASSKQSIDEVLTQITKVETQISVVDVELMKKGHSAKELSYWRKEKDRLGKKEEQLRKEKEQLRDEKNLLLSRFPVISAADRWTYHSLATKYANELRDAESKPIGAGVEMIKLKNYLQTSEQASPDLITRACVRELWAEVRKVTQTPFKNVLVTGSSGIGKSRSMAYLLRGLLLEGRTVVYHSNSEKTVFKFCLSSDGRYEAKYVDEDDFRPASTVELQDESNFYLVDTATNSISPPHVKAHTVLASSPNSEHFAQFVRNSPVHRLYMSPWSLEEMEAARREISPHLTTKELKTRFQHLGGFPRTVLGDESAYVIALEAALAAVATMKLDMLRSILQRLIATIDNRKPDMPSSHIVCYRAEAPYTKQRLAFVSEDVQQQLAVRYAEKLWNNMENLPKEMAAFKGYAFQELALKRLAAGGTFIVHFLPQSTKQQQKNSNVPNKEILTTISLPKDATIVRSDELPSLDTLDHNLWVSSKPNYPAIDAFGPGLNVAFNFTVSDDHALNVAGLKEVTLHVNSTSELPLRFFFVVPESSFQDWKSRKARPINDLFDRVQQYVLCIPSPLPSSHLADT